MREFIRREWVTLLVLGVELWGIGWLLLSWRGAP